MVREKMKVKAATTATAIMSSVPEYRFMAPIQRKTLLKVHRGSKISNVPRGLRDSQSD
jgi:hypothetical protein